MDVGKGLDIGATDDLDVHEFVDGSRRPLGPDIVIVLQGIDDDRGSVVEGELGAALDFCERERWYRFEWNLYTVATASISR